MQEMYVIFVRPLIIVFGLLERSVLGFKARVELMLGRVLAAYCSSDWQSLVSHLLTFRQLAHLIISQPISNTMNQHLMLHYDVTIISSFASSEMKFMCVFSILVLDLRLIHLIAHR